jgi:ubiquinone/menaquinone biosynthesis C-methylase UbiE
MKYDEELSRRSTDAGEVGDSDDPARPRVQSEVYDRDFFLSPLLEGYDEFQRGALSTVKARQLDMLEIVPGSRLLEVGFGRGEFLLHCARAGAQVAGVDYAEAAVDIGRETLAEVPGADLRRADARHLPYPEGTFDRVYSGDVIEHMCRADAIEMLAEMFRVLRPGGFLLVKTTPNTIFVRWIYPWAKRLLRLIDASGVALLEVQLDLMRAVHVYEYNPFSLRSAAREARLVSPKVWVDPDIFRSGGHKYSEEFKSNPLLRLVGAVGRMWPFPTLLGNDLYLKCVKPNAPRS